METSANPKIQEITGILPRLYPAVEVPPAVVDELRIARDRPGSRALREPQAAVLAVGPGRLTAGT